MRHPHLRAPPPYNLRRRVLAAQWLQWVPVLLAIPLGPDESTPKPASLLNDTFLRYANNLQTRFTQAEPFPHIAIDNFMKPEAAEKLLLDFPPFH